MTNHSSHPDIVKRLKRANGHLNSIIKMLEDDQECLLIAQQLLAVEKAIINAKKMLVHNHIDHCLESGLAKVSKPSIQAINEFKEITKYL